MRFSLLQTMPKPVASIVLPTFNEVENIVPLIEELHRCVDVPHEIIVVDDDSPDGTSAAVQRYIDAHPSSGVRLETRRSDYGLQKSISRGIDLATGEIICWMDCDFSHPPATLAQLIASTAGGCDVSVASRYVTGGSAKEGLRWFGGDESAFVVLLSQFLNWLMRTALDPRFRDYTSGFIAIRADVVRSLQPLYGDYGEYFMDLMYRAIKAGHSFCEIPFVSPPRRAGYSKTGTTLRQVFKRGVKYLRVIGRLWIL